MQSYTIMIKCANFWKKSFFYLQKEKNIVNLHLIWSCLMGWWGHTFIETGRLRTLSSTHESRKFAIDKKIRQLERLRWVYYTFFY